MKRPCFECNGTGQKCPVCGEASNACQCDDKYEAEGSFEKCENCKGDGTVEVPESKKPAKRAKGGGRGR